ncbi:MAG: hypothetical protein ACRCZD_12990, partial [Phycicoccus sp.]
MNRTIRTGLAAAFVLGSAVALAPTAAAEERVCRGSIGATTLDNIRVPTGATCTLDGTVLNGTLKVERGGTLYAGGIRVNGNLQAEGHRLVRVYTSRVGGSVQLVQGGTVDVRGTTVTGDVQLFSNTTGRVSYLAANRIDGNLQCKGNRPAPTGGDNTVQGNKEDQCAGL